MSPESEVSRAKFDTISVKRTTARLRMGMYAKFRHVSVTELRTSKKDPATFYRDLYGIKGKPVDRSTMLQSLGHQIGAAIKASSLAQEFTDTAEARRLAQARLQRKSPDPSDQEVVARKMVELFPKINFRPNLSQFAPRVSRIPKGLELEKSWHCLHFMFSGKVWKTGKAAIEMAILGGMEIPDTEGVMGYGPVRFLESSEVKKVTVALESYPIERAAAKFDPRAASVAKVYCPDHSPKELVHYFKLLTKYYREAVSKKHAMLLWIE